MSEPLLKVEHLSMRFGGLVAVDDLNFAAAPGEITAIIGPNGAGKTTVFNCLTGFYPPTVGRLTLDNPGKGRFLLEQMDGDRIAREAGVARTFQNIRLFSRMSVLENLMVAQHTELMRASVFSIAGLLGLPSFTRAERQAIELSRYWLRRMRLEDRAEWEAGNLPYGAQRRLEIDEPAAGLNPRESAELNEILLDIRRDHGVGILLIEHDMSVVMGISDHIVVLDYGRKIADAAPEAIRNDPAVIRAYLGADEEEDLPEEVAQDLPRGAH